MEGGPLSRPDERDSECGRRIKPQWVRAMSHLKLSEMSGAARNLTTGEAGVGRDGESGQSASMGASRGSLTVLGFVVLFLIPYL